MIYTRWHALAATLAANPITDDERAQVERAKVGDFTGLGPATNTATGPRCSRPWRVIG
jgi:hypothetical protein